MKPMILLSAVLVAALALPAHAVLLYSQAVLADNPVLYYRLNESSGTTAVNSATTGAANDGTYAVVSTGSCTLGQPGALANANPADTAVTFTGTPGGSGASPGAYIDSPFSFNPNATAFTVEFWINPASLETTGILFGLDQTILSQKNSGGTGRDIVYFDSNTGKMATAVNGITQDWSSNPASFVVGQYTMVDFVYNGAGGFQWYANGSPLGSAGTGTPTTDNGTLVIAAHKTLGAYLNGTLDEFALYTTALSDTQVATHFEAASAPEPCTGALLAVGGLLVLRRRARGPVHA